MLDFLKWFFRHGDNLPSGEGAYTALHLTCVGIYMVTMVVLAICLGIWAKNKDFKTKNKVLIWSAIFMDGFELIKIVNTGIQDPSGLLHVLPLFFCSIQLFSIPVAAFAKGRVKEIAIDFVCVFGILGAITGTVGAAQNYSAYPALSFPNVVSGITHSISGFASLYVIISGMATLKWKNALYSVAVLGVFAVAAYIANVLIPYNYMFLMSHDGTPYSIFWNMVGGHPVIYPFLVVFVFVVYQGIYLLTYHLIKNKGKLCAAQEVVADEVVEEEVAAPAVAEAAATDASSEE